MKPKKLTSLYVLVCPIEKIVRYVGISVDARDRYRRHLKPPRQGESRRKERWLRSIARRGAQPIMRVVASALDRATATRMEIALIARMREIVGKRLTNLTDGGDGTLGVRLTAAAVVARGAASRRVWSDPAYRLAMSERHRGVAKSDAHRRAIQAAHLVRAMAVVQIDPATGTEVARFPSGGEAARAVGLRSSGSISACCRGEQRTAAGFVWRRA